MLKDDELVIVSGRAAARTRRLRGALQVQQVWDLATARCRFGKFLRVAVNGKAPDIARLVRTFRRAREQSEQGELVRRAWPVRLSLARGGAQVELQLGEQCAVLPDRCGAGQLDGAGRPGQAAIVYE